MEVFIRVVSDFVSDGLPIREINIEFLGYYEVTYLEGLPVRVYVDYRAYSEDRVSVWE